MSLSHYINHDLRRGYSWGYQQLRLTILTASLSPALEPYIVRVTVTILKSKNFCIARSCVERLVSDVSSNDFKGSFSVEDLGYSKPLKTI